MLQFLKTVLKWFEGTTYEERVQLENRRVAERHFGEMIDWNVQTSMYSLLTGVIREIDPKYLKEMLNNECFDVQLKEALETVCKEKGIK